VRASRILSTYVLREVVQYAALGFLVTTLIMVSNNVVRHIEILVAAHFSLPDVLRVVGCLFAMLAPPAVPMAFLFGILLGIGRLSADSEITAMRAGGLGLSALLAPVFLLAMVISAVSAYLIIQVEPAAKRELRDVKVAVASRTSFVLPETFQRIGSRVLFVRRVDGGNRLEGVVIADRSDKQRPLLIFAERGELSIDAERLEARLLLESGEIHLEAEQNEEHYRRWSFESFDYALDLSTLLDHEKKLRPKEMTIGELRAVLERAAAGDPLKDLKKQNPALYSLQLHKRFALPVAPLVFALIGVPLGLGRGRGARAIGALMCVVLLFSYYALLSFGESLGERGAIPPAVGLWVPNVVFALGAIPLLRRASRGYG
jgi:lipopolysaccharide export system permease protein